MRLNRKSDLCFIFDKNLGMDSKIKYWIDVSDYDLETAEAMLLSKRYLYVGFMCHQTIEKAFKAYYTKLQSETAPFKHSLSYLARKGDFYGHLLMNRKNLLTS